MRQRSSSDGHEVSSPLGASCMAAIASWLMCVGATGVRPSRHGSSSLARVRVRVRVGVRVGVRVRVRVGG